MSEQPENRKIKLLFLITKGNFGGAQRYVYDLATNLPKNKFEVIVACGDQDGETLKNKLRDAGLRTLTLEGSGREVKVKKDFLVLKQILKLIKEENPDVIHLNSSKIGFLGVLAIIWLKFKKIFNRNKKTIPLSIFTIHGWAFNEKNRSFFWKFIFRFSYFVTILGSDKAIAVSEKTKKGISFLPFAKKKIVVIHNGIDKFETLIREKVRSILNGSEKTLILSIGELHPSKDFDVALIALSNLKEETKKSLDYRIIGGGEEKGKLEKLINELGLGETVKLLGPIDNAKNLLSGADVFLFPSSNENLPYALLEAGLAGLPVIASDVGGIPEIIDHQKSGLLVPPENPDALAKQISSLLEDKTLLTKYSSELKEKITRDFSIEEMIKKTKALYETKNL